MKVLFVVLASLSMGLSAMAFNADYNHASLSYVSADMDGTSDSLGGFGIAGEYVVHPQVLGKASYLNVSKNSLKLSNLRFGARYMHVLQPNMDLLVGADFVKGSAESGSTEVSDTEIGLNAHIRTKHNDKMQFEAGVELIDGDINFGGNMNYFFEKNISARGEIIFGDNNVYSVGGSYWF
jgi:hypothetical protein